MAVGAREAVVLMSLVHSLLFSGIIFGWPSFSMLLQQDGAFLDERCNATGFDLLDTACLLEQQTSLAMLYTVASTVFVFSLLLGGVMLDRCGAACTSTVAGVAFSSGFAMVACGDDHLLALAFALVGGGSSLAYSTTLATASLFRPSSRTLFIVTINGLFDLSALVPLALHAVSAAAEPDPTHRRAVIFSGLSALSALSFSLWAVTWRRQSARSHTRSVGQIRSSVREGFHVVPSRATPLRLQALQSQCRSPQLWLLSIWAGSLYLRASFYIVSARAYLQELGDHEGTYLTILLMMQPISILFGPPWAAAIDRCGHVRVMFAISLLSLAASTCTLLPSLQFQIVTFTLQGAVRAGLYPVAIGYLACVFGDKNLGSLTGTHNPHPRPNPALNPGTSPHPDPTPTPTPNTGLMFIGFGLFNLLIYPLMFLRSGVRG